MVLSERTANSMNSHGISITMIVAGVVPLFDPFIEAFVTCLLEFFFRYGIGVNETASNNTTSNQSHSEAPSARSPTDGALLLPTKNVQKNPNLLSS